MLNTDNYSAFHLIDDQQMIAIIIITLLMAKTATVKLYDHIIQTCIVRNL